MTAGPLLFEALPRSRQRRVLGHVIDAGNSDRGERTWARLRCRNGHEWDTHTNMTVTELRRGIPCAECEKPPSIVDPNATISEPGALK